MIERGRRELEQLIDDLADRLQRSVVVDDPTIRLIYSSRHFGDEDQQRIRAVLQHDVGGAATGHILGCGVESWPAPGPIPARDDLGMARRWCAPLRWHGHFLGVLMVIDADATLTDTDRTYIQTCAADISTLLFRDGAEGNPHRLDTAVADALSNEPDRRTAGLALLRDDDTFRDGGPCCVTTVRVLDGGDPIRVEAVLRSVLDIVTRSRSTTVAYRVHGVVAAVLQTGPPDPTAEDELADAISERTSTTLSGARVVCGIGSSRPSVSAAWESLRDSEIAADAATRVRGLGDTSRYDGLGAYAVLLRLPEGALTRGLLPAQLIALVAADPSGMLTETLAVYLANAGNSPRTAEALHVHRTSLYYRLGRIRELTGADLDDGNTRLSLQLGLAMLPLVDDAV